MRRFLLQASLLLFISIPAVSQEALKLRPSPLALATARYKDSYVKLTYSRPQKKGREIFGSVVPYGQVWRTGANEATEITLTRDIKINTQDLKAGTYSVFTIPQADRWTIIFNSDLGQWGSATYNDQKDVLKFDIPVTLLTDLVYEPFTIWIDQRNEKADLCMAWDKTEVIIPIQFLEPKQ